MAGGNFHSLGMRYNAELEPFGYNGNGELGTGDTTNHYSPDFEGGTLAVAIAGGGYHSLHLNAAGEVWEAGYNGDGELGLGDNADRHSWSYNGYIPTGHRHRLRLQPQPVPQRLGNALCQRVWRLTASLATARRPA